MRSVHQDQRLTFFCKDKARYFETAMTALGEEEKVYDNILEETLKALKIDMNVFITCQNFLMMDPDAQSKNSSKAFVSSLKWRALSRLRCRRI